MKKILLLLSILLSIFGSINYSSAFFSNIFNSIEINSRAELLANDSLDSSCVNEAIDYYESSGDASYITIPLTTRLIMCPVIDVEVEILNLKDAYGENEDISFDVNVSKGDDKIVEIEFSCSYINVQHYSVHTMYYGNNEIDSERRYYGSDNNEEAYAYTIEQSGLYNVDVSRNTSSSLDTQIPCRMYYVITDADSGDRIDSIVETFTLVSESNEVNTQVSIVDLEDTYREGEEISFDIDVVKEDSQKVLIEMNCHYGSALNYSLSRMSFNDRELDSEVNVYTVDNGYGGIYDYDTYTYTAEESGIYSVNVFTHSTLELDRTTACSINYITKNKATGATLSSTTDTFYLHTESVESEPVGDYPKEDACLTNLQTKINSDSRFSGIDLTEFRKDGVIGYDISNFNSFKSNSEINPNAGEDPNIFMSRRNNIATIITQLDFMQTHIVGGGSKSSFEFPLPVEPGSQEFGDKYSFGERLDDFREYVVYTHHLIDGAFSSCGIIKMNALGTNTLNNIDSSLYKTNAFVGEECSSSFEGDKISSEYYSMKTNICALDYSNKDFLKMELISIAHNTDSPEFNEYVAFQHQIDAMKDIDAQTEGLWDVMEKYRMSILNNTCFKVAHIDRSDLPAFCGGNFSGESDLFSLNEKTESLVDKIFSFFIPSAHADIAPVKDYKAKSEQASGLVMYEGLAINLYNKLQKIEPLHINLYNSLYNAMNPDYIDELKRKENNNIVLDDFEKTILKCDMSYDEKVLNVEDFLSKIDVTSLETLNLEEISYLNPKFGDCIIPFPDALHKKRIIKDSFASNKAYAMKLAGWVDDIKLTPQQEEISVGLQEIEKKNKELEDKKVKEAFEKFMKGDTKEDDYNKEKNEIIVTSKLVKKEETKKLLEVVEEKYSIELEIDEEPILVTEDVIEEGIGESNGNNYTVGIISILMLLLGGGVILLVVQNRKKQK